MKHFLFTFCFIGTFLDKCMGSELFLFSPFLISCILFLFSCSDFFLFHFCFLLQRCSRYCSWHKGKDLIFSTKAHVLYTLDWFNKNRLFCLYFFNCLCAMTLCIENSHGLCGFHTLCYYSV